MQSLINSRLGLMICILGSAICDRSISTAGANAENGAGIVEVQELDQRILAARRAIVSGSFRVLREFGPSPAGRETILSWIDGARIRQDVQGKDATVSRAYSEKAYYWYSTEVAPGRNYPLSITDLPSAQARSTTIDYNPLTLMFHPSFYLFGTKVSLQEYIGSTKREDLRVERDPSKEYPDQLKVSYRPTGIGSAAGSKVTYWVAPGCGYSVLRMQTLWRDEKGVAYDESTQCTLQKLGTLWFPQTVQYNRIVNGQLEMLEKLTVGVISLNQPISPETFTPSSMQVPAGTLVVRTPPDRRGSLKWDGQAVVLQTPQEEITRVARAPTESKGANRLWLLASSAVLASVATAMIVLRYLKGMRQKTV